MRVLELKAVPCELAHINLRKEGNEEKGLELANDLKLVFETDSKLALKALGCEDLADILPEIPCLKGIEFSSEFDRHDIVLKCGSAEVGIRNAKLKAFRLEFRDRDKAGVTFMAQIKPTLKQQATLADFLRESALVLSVLPPATLPGVAKKGKIEGKPTSKQKSAKLICPDCNNILKETDIVRLSAMDKNSPRIHRACFRKRMNKKTTKKKATKKKR